MVQCLVKLLDGTDYQVDINVSLSAIKMMNAFTGRQHSSLCADALS